MLFDCYCLGLSASLTLCFLSFGYLLIHLLLSTSFSYYLYSLPFRWPKISMIPSIVDYRFGIFPFNVNKCDVTRVIFKQKVFNHHNVLNDQSVEHDVAGITATICTTLEHFGNVPNRSFSYITLSISETVMWPNPRTRRKLAYIFYSASRILSSIF